MSFMDEPPHYPNIQHAGSSGINENPVRCLAGWLAGELPPSYYHNDSLNFLRESDSCMYVGTPVFGIALHYSSLLVARLKLLLLSYTASPGILF